MSWEDRVKEFITLTSPLGDFYEAKWIGGSRTFSKKLGEFSYPNVQGTVVQDLDSTSFTYPLTIYFDGADHDLVSEDFITSTRQKGLWTINHPVKGNLFLQLVDITENNQPVEVGSYTKIDMNFIDPVKDEVITSIDEISDDILSQLVIIDEFASGQFTQITQEDFSQISAIKETFRSIVGTASNIFSTLTESVAEINSQFNSIQNAINDTLDAVFVDPLRLAGQIQNLIALPALISANFENRFTAFQELASEIFKLSPDDNDTSIEALNVVLSQELCLSSILAITPTIGASSEFQIRSETLGALDAITNLFTETTTELDSIQKNFDDVFIDNQYFSQQQTFNEIVKTTALSNKLLIQRTFDLKIARTIVLKKPESPLVITLKEYGSIGENEENYELFLTSNNLSGDDILLLQSGREVVVYA